jgi:cytochrome d ubiquinol oxidase subunit I
MGVAAYHILKKSNLEFFKRSFRMAATFGLVCSILLFIVGDFHASQVAKTQPTKFAAMESLWETEKAVPYHLIVIPDTKNERNLLEAIGIPKLMSFLAFYDANAEIKGLKEFPPQDRPPVLPTFLSFRIMVALGFLFIILSIIAYIISRKGRLEYSPTFLKVMLYSIPLPYIAGQLGWIVAEVGRQPWIVYGIMRTSDAVSQAIVTSQVWTSLIGFTLFYGMLGIIDVYLLAKFSKKGPDEDISSFIKMPKKQEV